MVTISKPISSGQAQAYHKEEFANAKENYYTEGEQVRGQWQGQLAERWGLTGDVKEEQFARLSEGQHPATGEQLVRHQTAREYENGRGEMVRSMEHRAGWDATFSAPKSVSLTALVGGDDRIREAHRESVTVALNEMERYVQGRIGGNAPAETTAAWAVAKFEHDSSRPVEGYAAPQLHTHAVVFNVTETADGNTRALQPQELYKTQQYATAVYRSELAERLQGMGYEIERGDHGQPEIKGYSREYLEASSPRRQQIEAHMAAEGRTGAGAAQVAAHQTRDRKQPLSHDEVRERHQAMARVHGDQPQRVLEEAAQRPGVELRPDQSELAARGAVTYARERGMEREAVTDERSLMRDALKHTMGEARLPEIKAEFERRVESREMIEVPRKEGLAGRAFTTGEMQGYERELIDRMKPSQGNRDVLAEGSVREQTMKQHEHLSLSQRNAVDTVLTSRDQMMALEGVAGAGKTTSLAAVREAAVSAGYEVEGLAPTSRAAQKLGEAGMETETLQRHLTRGDRADGGQKRLYVVDESSMASTKQMHTFVERLKENDRVLFVGDTRQHEAVEAGRPYAQLQEAGMKTARLDEIIRQKDPALKEAVEQLARGDVREAIGNLNRQGRVHEIGDRQERIGEIAREYVRQPENTLTIASTGKDPATGRLLTHQYRVEGPVMIFLTTTAIQLDEELLNRCLVLSVNEEREQTQAIHRVQREAQTLEGLLKRRDRDAILAVHRNAQRLLKPVSVVNPYARELTFNDGQTRTRRDHTKYLTMIRTIALLHQYQRPRKTTDHRGRPVDYIEVTLDDIAMANRLVHEVLGRSLDELPPQTRRLLLAVDEMVAGECGRQKMERPDYRFSRRDVRAFTGWGDTQLKVHLQRLEELEYLLIHRGGRGQSIVYELMFTRPADGGKPVLGGLIDIGKLTRQ